MDITIAKWMFEEFNRHGALVQSRAARGILSQFGSEYVYKNRNGNYAITREILDKFKQLTDRDIVWSRSKQMWRRRRPGDPDSRMVK